MEKSTDKKYIIFDFDGTLVNTNDVIIASWMDTYEHFLGYRPDEKDVIHDFGETLAFTCTKRFPGFRMEDVRDHYRAFQEAHSDRLVHVFDGIHELLDELKSRGCKLGVATSRTFSSYEKYMQDLGLTGYMDAVVTVEDVSSHKPAPESAECVLKKLGGTPEEALFIGDTRFDIGCANSAGIDSVLVGWSHWIDEEQMINSGLIPTHYALTPAAILDLL